MTPQSLQYAVGLGGMRTLLLAIAVAVLAALVPGFFRYRQQAAARARGEVVRHPGGVVVLHWLNAAGFLIAMYSGLVLLRWLPGPSSRITLYLLHYIGAVVSVFAVLAVAFGLSWRRRAKPLIPSGATLAALGREIAGYFGAGGGGFLGFGRSEPAASADGEKYLATEKGLSYPGWALVLGVLFVTGVLKALNYAWRLPPELLRAATVVHDVAAVASVVMLVLHVGAVVAVRTNWPLLRSMFVLTVPEAYARRRHPLWWQSLRGEAPGIVAPADPAVAGIGTGLGPGAEED